MKSWRGTVADSFVVVISRFLVLAGPPVILVLALPFTLAGFSFAAKVFFWATGCSMLVVLGTLCASLANSKVQFIGAFVLLIGLAMLFRFVPPFEWQYMGNLAYGAYSGCLLSIIPASGRAKQLPDR